MRMYNNTLMRLFVLTIGLLAATAGTAQAGKFTLQVDAADSHDQVQKQFVYNQAGCDGGNEVPVLKWENEPKGTSGFAVTVYDPDADGGWWHWVVLDIPSITHHIGEREILPPGAFALKNSFGHARWDGPCPPAGDSAHDYQFTVYALDTAALALSRETSPQEAKDAIKRHSLGKAQVTYTYKR